VNDFSQVASNTKAGRTRSAILTAAERLFAKSGYAATRLEDVADVVGLTRAALFYHFRDKETLYNAMIEDAFGELAEHLEEALSQPGSVARRIERACEAWVDAMVARPTLARLILRHVADAEERPMDRIHPSSERLFRKYWGLFEDGCASGELKPLHDNPFHAASAVLGHTVFYVSALASLIPTGDFKSLAADEVEAHKRDIVGTVQHQLGIVPERNTAERGGRERHAAGRSVPERSAPERGAKKPRSNPAPKPAPKPRRRPAAR
jgi:TetR/AcrR family transcriptional regulator